MVKISRYFLVIAGILAFSVVLPELYWMAFAKPVNRPFVMYSCIENDFLFQRTENGESIRKDTRGNTYSREEFEQRLPLMYTRQLLISKTMPDSINGIELDMHLININNSTFRLRPVDTDSPKPGLYPLFESQSGRANLELPDDFFRITWRMEFVDAETNRVLEEKSRMFSAVLYKRGFQFPAKSINGLPTTRKSCDEGYLVVDAANQLFHIKMKKGEPFVKKVDLPDGLRFKHISCVDFRNKNFYAYLFTDENNLYILTQDDYELVELPVGEMNPEEFEIQIFGDLFHYHVIARGEDFFRVVALDASYRKVDEYTETWPGRMERKEGKIFQAVFPGQISLTNPKSAFVNFYVLVNPSFYWILVSLILVAAQLVIVRKRKIPFKNQWVDLCLIAVSGIFGFFAVNIFPNKLLPSA